jgi:hypothetical protein
LLDRLEFKRLGGDVGKVEPGQGRDRAVGVIVGGTADQAEAGQADDGIDLRLPVTPT